VTINELIIAVNNALGGCNNPTPTEGPPPTKTRKPTATRTPNGRRHHLQRDVTGCRKGQPQLRRMADSPG